jgi:hypothetical protein
MTDADKAHPNIDLWKRLVGEFLIIVAGVLVALAVDDMRQSAADRELEQYLVVRVSRDIDEDLSELARATLRAERKIWLIDALLASLDDLIAFPASEYPQGEADRCRPSCDPRSPEFRPLATLSLMTKFDVTNAAYQEMLSTGSLRVLQDRKLRDRLARFYNEAQERAAGDHRLGLYQEKLNDMLEMNGLVQTDPVDLDELINRLRADPSIPVILRRFRYTVSSQIRHYVAIKSEAESIRSMIAQE